MAREAPCASYMALYIISMHIVNSNSRSSSHHWKLNLSAGKVQQADAETKDADKVHDNKSNERYHNDRNETSQNTSGVQYDKLSNEIRVMEILQNKIMMNGEWMITSQLEEELLESRNKQKPSAPTAHHQSHSESLGKDNLSNNPKKVSNSGTSSQKSNFLSCGKPVNSTQFDHLRGISQRHQHAHVPERDVAMVFKDSSKSSDIDMAHLEKKLRKAKRELLESGKTHSNTAAQVYNLIGNFWRIKGNTQLSIECFRKALSILPESPEILLNLARVLFHLQYLDDAIFLARRSLYFQPTGENAWLQHFTLGEILKSYGHPQEAVMHFNQAVELNPDFKPARSQLLDLTSDPHPSITHITIFIILVLVAGVLFWLLTSMDFSFHDSSSGTEGSKSQRHFNRAMAMRSIKLGINPRLCRLRKGHQ